MWQTVRRLCRRAARDKHRYWEWLTAGVIVLNSIFMALQW